MKIDKILASIRSTQTPEKTAAEVKPAQVIEKVAAPRDALVAALNSAVAAAPSVKDAEKTAAEIKSPVTDLMKIAQDVNASEKEAALNEAKLLGAAFADAAVVRLAEWQKSAAALPAPVAVGTLSVPTPMQQGNVLGFGKFASENPELIKQAHQLGYEQAKQELEKQANDAYNKGFDDQVTQIHKVAAVEFYKAAVLTGKILDAQSAA